MRDRPGQKSRQKVTEVLRGHAEESEFYFEGGGATEEPVTKIIFVCGKPEEGLVTLTSQFGGVWWTWSVNHAKKAEWAWAVTQW